MLKHQKDSPKHRSPAPQTLRSRTWAHSPSKARPRPTCSWEHGKKVKCWGRDGYCYGLSATLKTLKTNFYGLWQSMVFLEDGFLDVCFC